MKTKIILLLIILFTSSCYIYSNTYTHHQQKVLRHFNKAKHGNRKDSYLKKGTLTKQGRRDYIKSRYPDKLED